MAPQPSAPAPQPPPDLPSMDISDTLANYLRTFALWTRNMFGDKLDAHRALPGLMISSYGATTQNPPVYMFGVNPAGLRRWPRWRSAAATLGRRSRSCLRRPSSRSRRASMNCKRASRLWRPRDDRPLNKSSPASSTHGLDLSGLRHPDRYHAMAEMQSFTSSTTHGRSRRSPTFRGRGNWSSSPCRRSRRCRRPARQNPGLRRRGQRRVASRPTGGSAGCARAVTNASAGG